MADLSLGERLLALPNGAPNGDVKTPKSKAVASAGLDGPVNAASLTRLLVQALHTSDPALLTICLSHRDPMLIRNTIRKMPAQMALPLLKACVERLGHGKGANRRGGTRGAGQNEQQGRGTVEWVKGVLVERGAILMTVSCITCSKHSELIVSQMPSLPLHLANLSSLLKTRLQLYQPLLSLAGRLDLALAQITMRRIAAEQMEAMKIDESKRGDGERYIEGESDDEDDEVAIEVGDGDGEIEDVDMRVVSTE
jgi:U3 small nucleolar RNA-associated protein 5